MLELTFKDGIGACPYSVADMETLGTRLKTLREARGWTQDYVGKQIGVTLAAVSHWETDTVKNPKLETFLALVELYDTDPHYLVFGADRGASARAKRAQRGQPPPESRKPKA